MIEFLPWLLAMGLLMLCSGFFSSSEAALFLLTSAEQRTLASGNRAQRLVAQLLSDPDRLLTAVLFWNLVVNVTYFAIASIAALRLERLGQPELAGGLTFVALMLISVCSEMLPKSIAMLKPRGISTLVALPLSFAIQVIDPLLPVLRWANLLSRRLIWPNFVSEEYLNVADLERAVALSTTDASLLQNEKTVLQNIVSLSAIRVEEMMRPRMQFLSFRPPVAVRDLEGRLTPSGYVLVTEGPTEEVAAAIPIRRLADLPRENLERHAQEVFYMPWCSSGGQALEQMLRREKQVAAVVNEFGETIGILTFDDILNNIFTPDASRSARLLHQSSIQPISEELWRVTGMTTLRRLARHFDVELPASRSTTAAGAVQEVLGRLPRTGDRCDWGPFQFEVADVPDRGQMLLELRRLDPTERNG